MVDSVVVLLAAIELDDEVLVKLFHPLVAEVGEPRLPRLFIDQQLFMDEPANGQQESIVPSVAIKLHLLEQPTVQPDYTHTVELRIGIPDLGTHIRMQVRESQERSER